MEIGDIYPQKEQSGIKMGCPGRWRGHRPWGCWTRCLGTRLGGCWWWQGVVAAGGLGSLPTPALLWHCAYRMVNAAGCCGRMRLCVWQRQGESCVWLVLLIHSLRSPQGGAKQSRFLVALQRSISASRFLKEVVLLGSVSLCNYWTRGTKGCLSQGRQFPS